MDLPYGLLISGINLDLLDYLDQLTVRCRLYRSVKYLAKTAAASRLKSVPIPPQVSYTVSKDVTVVVPTIQAESGFTEALLTWVRNNS